MQDCRDFQKSKCLLVLLFHASDRLLYARLADNHCANIAWICVSFVSGVVLGGVEYPVGSRVGKSGTFVIGDPALFEPYKSFESVR